jgi:hypothetical protein
MKRHFAYRLLLALLVLSAATAAHAQPADTGPWSISFGIGWDNSISGNINSGGIGTINGQAVVILKNTYEDVYGTGLHLRGGVGYMLDEETEVRGDFIFQSLDADLTRLGDIGVSNLYGQYTDYQSFGLDVGLRRYIPLKPEFSVYGEGAVGLGFVDKTDITLVAPRANLSGKSNDFYDQTVSFAFGGNVGVLIKNTPRFGIFAQVGLRWTSGMSEIDDLEGTGLETINDKSARWTFPFVAGVRVGF